MYDDRSLFEHLKQAQAGDAHALNVVIHGCLRRLRVLASRMLQNYPRVRRWEDTDDIVQEATLRLIRALRAVPIKSTRDFFCLAATQIRRELIDLARHYCGPHGWDANYESGFYGSDDDSGHGFDAADEGSSLGSLARWSSLHDMVDELEPAQREVFSLVYYHGWRHSQIAALFQVDERTVRRRWSQACDHLRELLGSDWSSGLRAEVPSH